MQDSQILHQATSSCSGLGMRVLHFTPNSTSESVKSAITTRGYHVVSCSHAADALRLILNDTFNAVVIENEDGDLDVIDFTIAANRIDPRLPVFLTSDWGSELPSALEDLMAGAFATS